MLRITDQSRVRILTLDHAGALKVFNEPIASLVKTKRTIVAAYRRGVESTRQAETWRSRDSSDIPPTLTRSPLLPRGRPEFARIDSEYPLEVGMRHSEIESN